MPIDLHGRPTIATYSGVEFSPLNPKPEQINIEDIAHGLGFTCRYAAQVPRFYSVAEHSILVCKLLKKRFPKEKELHLWGLLHDASEAYLGDMPSPLKKLDAEYRKTEARVTSVIADVFSLSPREQPKEVHEADFDIFLKEKEQLWCNIPVSWWQTPSAPQDTNDLKFSGFSCNDAEIMFLCNFDRISAKLNE